MTVTNQSAAKCWRRGSIRLTLVDWRLITDVFVILRFLRTGFVRRTKGFNSSVDSNPYDLCIDEERLLIKTFEMIRFINSTARQVET